MPYKYKKTVLKSLFFYISLSLSSSSLQVKRVHYFYLLALKEN